MVPPDPNSSSAMQQQPQVTVSSGVALEQQHQCPHLPYLVIMKVKSSSLDWQGPVVDIAPSAAVAIALASLQVSSCCSISYTALRDYFDQGGTS